ncbi:MAG: hypothetical protein QM756_36200 [Polyangiaceae bacterium]
MLPELIARLRDTIPPSNGDNLLGFKLDCDVFFARPEVVAETVTIATTDPSELLRILVRLSPTAATLQDVRQALTTAWQDVAYSEFQATSLKSHREATVLHFATVIEGSHFFVSGVAIATGSNHEDLVRAFELNFGTHRDPVSRIPGGLPAWANDLLSPAF